MISVRLHVQKDGTVWAMCKCSACKEVHKYAIRDAIASPIECKRCGHKMDIKGAVIEAVDRMPGAARGGNPGGSNSSAENGANGSRKSKRGGDGQDARPV